MYDPVDMTTSAAFEANSLWPPQHVSCVLQKCEAGRAIPTGMGGIGNSEREMHEAQALTFGMISMIDAAVGRVRSAINAERAMTIFTTDHVDHLEDHKMLFKGAEAYEEVTRVPFIWNNPEQKGITFTDATRQTHDIGITILERARIESAVGIQGKLLLRWTRSRIHSIRSSE